MARYTVNRQMPRHLLFATLGIVIILVASGALLYRSGHLPFWHKKVIPSPTANSNTKGAAPSQSQPAPTEQSATTGGASTTPNPPSKDQGNGPTTTLLAPSGDFVSNHHPNLSNSPSGSGYIASVCTTTPGATCTVTFTLNGATKSLAAETTDAGGSAYWSNWRPQDIGLTVGSWKIQAVATLGNQTKITNDALTLDITQ